MLSGVSAYGHAIGVGSSYGAFMAPLGHIAARLHAIGAQARQAASGDPYRPMILICAHAGLATGEDGPTHADPQALQIFQENFPRGTAVTLTPWEPQEIWPLLASRSRAAAGADRALCDPARRDGARPRGARSGGARGGHDRRLLPAARRAATADVTIVLQESAVTYAFVTEALPLLEREGIDARVYYVASAELYDSLPLARRRALFPEEYAWAAIGITGFTLPTLYRWVRGDAGREATLHPYRKGHYLGSGQGDVVLAEAGLDGESQFVAIKKYVDDAVRRARRGGGA